MTSLTILEVVVFPHDLPGRLVHTQAVVSVRGQVVVSQGFRSRQGVVTELYNLREKDAQSERRERESV